MADTLLHVMLHTLSILFVFALAVGGVFEGYMIIRDTVRREGWFGVNLRRVRCPRCAELMPRFRWPLSFRQGYWGGCTCVKCGCEMDKWGREVRTHESHTA